VASARREGNTETLARLAAAQLPPDVEQVWIHLDEHRLAAFEDIRHWGGGKNNPYPQPAGNEQLLLDATLAATDIVFVTPVYWYSMPSTAKLYLDHWSGWMRVPGVDFRKRMAGKTLWGVSVLADEDPKTAQYLLGTLRTSAEYMGMHWGGELIGNGSAPGDVLKDREAVEKAHGFFAGAIVSARP
jgi:multimeric flavodoxin WrbA